MQNKMLLFVWLLTFAFSCILCFVRLYQHYVFQTNCFDLGLEASVAWNTAHGRLFYDSLRDINYLADHFSPVYILFVPFVKLFDPAQTLLVIQSLILSASFPAAYLLANRFTHSKVLSLSTAFLLIANPFFHYVSRFDFHPEALAIALLLWLFYFMETRRWYLFGICLALCLCLKENIPIAVTALGIYAVFKKRLRIVGLMLILSGAAAFYLENAYIMPYFSKGWVNYHWYHRYSHLGPTFKDAIKNILLNPSLFLKPFLLDWTRAKTLYRIVLNTGFLCLLSPTALLALLIVLLQHLLSNYTPQLVLSHHYSSTILPFIVLATSNGIRNARLILRKIGIQQDTQKKLLIAIILCVIVWMLHNWPGYITHYDKEKVLSAYNILKEIPPDASVAAQNEFVPHLTARREIKFLFLMPSEVIEKMEFVLLDISNTKPHPLTEVSEWKKYMRWLLIDSSFGVFMRDGNIILMKKSYDKKANFELWDLLQATSPCYK
jgi:uncharacterized membrane protein